MQSQSAQLGSVEFQLPIGSTTFFTSSWSSVTPAQIEELSALCPEALTTTELLARAARDPGLGFSSAACQHGLVVRIRCCITPSDANGSTWKKVRWKRRELVVKSLLQTLSRAWEVEDPIGGVLMGLTDEDYQNMPDIYASVPSPRDPVFLPASSAADEEAHTSLANYENPQGVETELYLYQIRSVAKMLQMETQPQKLVDPLFLPFQEAGKEDLYYLNMTTWDIQRHPGCYDLPRGGILCEQMGTGKTLMCLSLITSTLHQSTAPPLTAINVSRVITNVAERTYPFLRQEEFRSLTGFPASNTCVKVPSLVELCADIVSVQDPSISRSPYIPPHLKDLLKRQKFYCNMPVLDEQEACARVAKKKSSAEIMRFQTKTYLAQGTLVIVPQILVAQWRQEIEKHIEEGLLKVYEATSDELPSIDKLSEYDIIIMDINRFSFEQTIFREARGLKPSVLLQARWKRIILDEGHIAHSKTTNAMTLAMELSIERRWIVSGTPTRHLQQGGEIEMESMNLPGTPESSKSTLVPTPLSTGSRCAWSKRDIEDATRLGVMIGGFLAAEPFRSEGRFQQWVTAHLRGKNGPVFGAVRRMKYLLSGILVKHGPKVIDKEARLPPSTIIKEIIQFNNFQRVTYNVLAALVASNVYTSGGEDTDYLLHPRNVESSRQVVTNLHLACFWYSARDMGTEACLARTGEWLEQHPAAPAHIKANLREACQHLQQALNTPGWEEWMNNAISMPCDGTFLPSILKHAWSDSFDTQPDMVDVHSLNRLRELNRKGSDIQSLHMEGWRDRVAKCDYFWGTLTKGVPRHVLEADFGKEAVKAVVIPKKDRKKENNNQSTSAAHAPKEAPKSPIKKRKRNDEEIDGVLDEAQKNAATLSSISDTRPRPLAAVIHTKTRSSKVNFVLKTVLEAPVEDKFVIFGNNYELGHLTEALDLVDVTSTFVGHTILSKSRRKALDMFEKPGVRVCLMDLKLAARGLNLVAANRMVFLAPVWNLDVQAQAIKRVHRIGQTRLTTVQILVTEGTFEEDIVKRSTVSRSTEEEQLYSRAMIENPRFVYAEADRSQAFAARFCPDGHLSELDSSSSSTTHQEAVPVTPPQGEKSRSRKVMFASPTPSPNHGIDPPNKIDGDPHVSKLSATKSEGEGRKKRPRVSFA